MKNKRSFRLFVSLMAVMLSMAAFSIPAYAGGAPETEELQTEAPKEPEPVPLTPEGNLTLVDDIDKAGSEDKQFITVVRKNGKTFNNIINTAAHGENTVHI